MGVGMQRDTDNRQDSFEEGDGVTFHFNDIYGKGVEMYILLYFISELWEKLQSVLEMCRILNVTI